MTHTRSLLIGAVIGSAVSFGTMGFIACQSSTDKNSASAAGDKDKAGAKDKKKPNEPKLPPQSAEELGEPIATIDGYTITVADFQDRINKQSPYIRARYTSLERKKEFLDTLIRFEVLANEATRQGLDKDPEIVRTMKQVMIQKLMKNEFDTRVKTSDVSEAEMKEFYEAHKTEYNKPEEVRASAIIVRDKATADKVAGEAKGAKGADNKGFRDLVNQYSVDEPTKQRSGDLKYFSTESTEVPPEVIKAAFELSKTGDVAGPIATKAGFFIIKQTGRRKALAKSFDEVKKQIQNRIYRDKRTKAMEDFVVNLKTKAKITVHEEKLSKVRIDTTTPAPAQPGHDGDGVDPAMDPHGGMAPTQPDPTAPPR